MNAVEPERHTQTALRRLGNQNLDSNRPVFQEDIGHISENFLMQ
jgi:hypothetical protein